MKKLTLEEILEFVQNENNQRILHVFELERVKEQIKVKLNDTEIQVYLIHFQSCVKEKHEENKDLKLPNAAQILQNFAWRLNTGLGAAKLKLSDENILSIPDEPVIEYLDFYQKEFLEPFQK